MSVTERFVSKEFMAQRADLLRWNLVGSRRTDEQSHNTYRLPVPVESILAFGSREASPTHVGNLSNSIDFYVPVRTPVFAAADGFVTKIRNSSKLGGNNLVFWDLGNFIDVIHDEREHTWYEHLDYNGIAVSQGQRVKQGEIIGYSGNTGFTENPHLHFHVYRQVGSYDSDFVTLRARFEDFPDVYELTGLNELLRKN